MKSSLAALAFTVLFPGLAHADTLSEDVIGELYAMRSVYKTEYAPAQWKKKYAGYELEANFQQALGAAQSHPAMTIQESREIFKNFIYAMKDYHVSVSFTATEQATLPLTIKGAGDRFFLAYIDRSKLPETVFPFHVGDELLSFDGKPVLEAVKAVQSALPGNVEGTDRALAELSLTSRRAAKGYVVPRGPVALGIRPNGKEGASQVQLIWDYVPETIFPRGDLGGLLNAGVSVDVTPASSSLFHPIMTTAEIDTPGAENPYGVGSRRTFTPALGPKVFETEESNTFHAYIYKTPDRKLIGYLRLPSYVSGDYKKAVADFAAIVARFEATTDSMVIDQVNNPGGSIFYLYTLASMLSDQPLRTPAHRMSVTQADVVESQAVLKRLQNVTDDESARKNIAEEDLNGYPASYEFAQFSMNFARFLISEWKAGRKLTHPYWVGGVDQINPSPTRYTKPILLLINHLDFSGGDFFPTILQDNKRVTILGSRTAGAGGYVNDVKIPNNVGISAFRVTESIAERVDGNPIENLGVTPDILYEMSPEDYRGGFAPYARAIQDAVGSITP